MPNLVNMADCGNTSNFKSWICFTVLWVVWGRAMSCCRHAWRPQDMSFPLNCWLQLIPKYITVLYCTIL
jgi:hypothetical protein